MATKTEEALELLKTALKGTQLDEMDNRDDDGLLFACQMGWIPKAQREQIGRVKDAPKLLKQEVGT